MVFVLSQKDSKNAASKSLLTRVLGLLLLLGVALGPSPEAQAASKMRIYLLTATYGVMAGTLTGVASLAFYSSAPGSHLRNIAVGASLGLYVGLLLGTYLIYFQPDPNSKKESPKEEAQTSDQDLELRQALDTLPRLSPIVSWTPASGTTLGLSYHF